MEKKNYRQALYSCPRWKTFVKVSESSSAKTTKAEKIRFLNFFFALPLNPPMDSDLNFFFSPSPALPAKFHLRAKISFNLSTAHGLVYGSKVGQRRSEPNRNELKSSWILFFIFLKYFRAPGEVHETPGHFSWRLQWACKKRNEFFLFSLVWNLVWYRKLCHFPHESSLAMLV